MGVKRGGGKDRRRLMKLKSTRQTTVGQQNMDWVVSGTYTVCTYMCFVHVPSHKTCLPVLTNEQAAEVSIYFDIPTKCLPTRVEFLRCQGTRRTTPVGRRKYLLFFFNFGPCQEAGVRSVKEGGVKNHLLQHMVHVFGTTARQEKTHHSSFLFLAQYIHFFRAERRCDV